MEHLTHVLTAIDADSDVAQVRRFRQASAGAAASAVADGAPRPRGGEAVRRRWSSSDATSRPSSPACARRCCPRRGWRRGIEYLAPPGAPAARHPAPHRARLRLRGVRLVHPVLRRCTSCSAAGARLAGPRQHGRGADRHLRRQPADLPADRLGLARRSAGASSATAPAARLRAGSRTPSAQAAERALGEPAQPSSAAARASGAGSSRSSTTCSGPTSSAACCPGSPRRSPATMLLRPLVAAYQAAAPRADAARGRATGWRREVRG